MDSRKVKTKDLVKNLDHAINEWSSKRNQVFQMHSLDKDEVYKCGNFLDLPPECLMAVCYVDAYRCVQSWLEQE